MEDIQVGEWIRTKTGLIRKVKTLYSGKRQFTRTTETLINGKFKLEDIIKHSFNIIDLIEVNDFVNGKRVFATDNRINDNGEKVILTENYDEWTDDGVIANKDIKEILTKEQYNSNCYRLEE